MTNNLGLSKELTDRMLDETKDGRFVFVAHVSSNYTGYGVVGVYDSMWRAMEAVSNALVPSSYRDAKHKWISTWCPSTTVDNAIARLSTAGRALVVREEINKAKETP